MVCIISCRFANDVIATTAFGLKVNSLEEKQNIFHRMGEQIVNFKGFLKGINFMILMFLPRLSKVKVDNYRQMSKYRLSYSDPGLDALG